MQKGLCRELDLEGEQEAKGVKKRRREREGEEGGWSSDGGKGKRSYGDPSCFHLVGPHSSGTDGDVPPKDFAYRVLIATKATHAKWGGGKQEGKRRSVGSDAGFWRFRCIC